MTVRMTQKATPVCVTRIAFGEMAALVSIEAGRLRKTIAPIARTLA
jgi:hypothetical protein